MQILLINFLNQQQYQLWAKQKRCLLCLRFPTIKYDKPPHCMLVSQARQTGRQASKQIGRNNRPLTTTLIWACPLVVTLVDYISGTWSLHHHSMSYPVLPWHTTLLITNQIKNGILSDRMFGRWTVKQILFVVGVTLGFVIVHSIPFYFTLNPNSSN